MFKPFAPHMIDFYKTGHVFQMPDFTDFVCSNFTPRSDTYAHVDRDFWDGQVVAYGIQGFIQEFLIECWNESFFSQPKAKVIARYQRRMDLALGEGFVTTDHLKGLHDLGYLPLEVKALPEGSLVPIKVPVFTIRNTVKGYGWLVGVMEDALSNENWKAITTATTAFQYLRLLTKFAQETGDEDFVRWQAHDFSFRGMSGLHDGCRSGGGHLLSFQGSDTVGAYDYLEDYYGASSTFLGGGIPASEHLVMCLGGKDNELETIRRLITKVYPNGMVGIVSDTWSYWNVINNFLPILKNEILARGPDAFGNSKVVFRPDSGNPVNIIAGYNVVPGGSDSLQEAEETLALQPFGLAYDEFGDFYDAVEIKGLGVHEILIDERSNTMIGIGRLLEDYEVKGTTERLSEIFGGNINAKGYTEVLNRVGSIYGDSITLVRARRIMTRLKRKYFASTNVVFGIGSYTYQYVTRDSLGQAMKGTHAVIAGVPHDIFKDPATDNGVKKSAKGLQRVERNLQTGRYEMFDQQTEAQFDSGELRTVFKDSVAYNVEEFATMKTRLHSQL